MNKDLVVRVCPQPRTPHLPPHPPSAVRPALTPAPASVRIALFFPWLQSVNALSRPLLPHYNNVTA
jgi:hypothetical protein